MHKRLRRFVTYISALWLAGFLAACGGQRPDVANGNAASTPPQAERVSENTMQVPSGAIKITVSKDGFSPATVDAKKGQPVRLAFERTDANNCAEQVVFSSMNIKKDLPVGKVVMVEFVPKDDREISFACGMGMMQGKVVLN